MSESSFDGDHAEALAALAQERGPCPDATVLAAYAAGGELADAERQRVRTHLELCPSCQEAAGAGESPPEVDEVSWRRAARGLDARARPWAATPRRRLPLTLAAAVVTLAAGLAAWRVLDAPAPPPSSPVVRGAALRVLAPAGEVTGIDLFDWNELPLDLVYTVEIETRDGSPVFLTEVAAPPLRASDELRARLDVGSYRWRVVARGADGDPVAEADWTLFDLVE